MSGGSVRASENEGDGASIGGGVAACVPDAMEKIVSVCVH